VSISEEMTVIYDLFQVFTSGMEKVLDPAPPPLNTVPATLMRPAETMAMAIL
jgi:hypothetical protein